MAFNIKNGDMFAGKHDILVNAVNCVGVMGAGVAMAIRRNLGREVDAEYFACYQRACQSGHLFLGGLNVWDFRPFAPYGIVNFPTMYLPGGAVNPAALRASTKLMRDYIIREVAATPPDKRLSVGIPALGCGIGDFAFSDLVPILRHGLDNVDAEITLYAPR